MNDIIKYLLLALTVLTFVSCTQSPDTKQNQARLVATHPRTTILDVSPENRQRRVSGMTNMVMRKMGDAVPDEKQEEVTMLVRGFFIADVERKMTLAASQRMAAVGSPARIEASRKFRYDLEILYENTEEKANALLDKKGTKLLIKTLETFVRPPRPPRSENWGDEPDTRWLDID